MKTVYLNHAGTSWPKPSCVLDATQKAAGLQLSELDARFDAQHGVIAQFFGAQNKERLLLTPGCTSSIGLALADIVLPHGSKIVTSSFEHHAMHRNLLHKVSQGYQLEIIPPALNSCFDLQRLEQTLQAGDVGLVAVCSASNVTGHLLPIDSIAKLAKEYEALVVVDGAQTVGWLNHQLDSSDIDVFAFGGHKGLLAPWGIGGLYVREGVPMATPSAVCQLPDNSNIENEEKPKSCSVMPGYCDGGSVDRMALAGLAASLNWIGKVEERLLVALALTTRILDAINSLPGVIVYGWGQRERQLPTIAFNIRDLNTHQLAEMLRERGIQAAVGLQCSPMAHQVLGTEPDGVVRMSVGALTTEAEVDQVVEVLENLRKVIAR